MRQVAATKELRVLPSTTHSRSPRAGQLFVRQEGAFHLERTPINDGYSFRILTAQSAGAKVVAKKYIVDGNGGSKMTGGFAVLAWPVKYGDSGVMTFMSNWDGVVYQRDLARHSEGCRLGLGIQPDGRLGTRGIADLIRGELGIEWSSSPSCI